MQKTLCLITPPNISPLGACTWKIALKYKVKQSKNSQFISNYKASPIIFLKCKFPSVDKPLQNQAPQKGPLKNISPGAYFQNFMVYEMNQVLNCRERHEGECDVHSHVNRFLFPFLYFFMCPGKMKEL